MVAAVGFSYSQALTELSDMVQASVAPVLTTTELGRLLRYAATGDEDGNEPDAWPGWAGLTEYALGERVVPATRNGYVYIVTTAGTSGSAAPTWPTTDAATVTDGTVVWTNEDTAAWTPTYGLAGLNRAALEGWQRKFARLTAGETFSADGASFNPEARRRDIEKMIDFYRKRAGGVGSFKLTGRTSRVEGWDDLTSELVVN